MTDSEHKNIKNRWLQNLLFWNKKANYSQNKGICDCQKADESFQNKFNSLNKNEDKMSGLNINQFSNQNDTQQIVKYPGKVFASERRGCGFHVYFCIENIQKSNHARNNQLRKSQTENNSTTDGYEDNNVDPNICKQMMKFDEERNKLAIYGNNFSSAKSTHGQTNFKSDHGNFTNDVYNSKAVPFSSTQTVTYTLENFNENNFLKEHEAKQTNILETNFSNIAKDKLKFNHDKEPLSGGQTENTEENYKMKKTDSNLKIYEEMKLINNFIHHTKEVPENIILGNNNHGDSIARNQLGCINPKLIKDCNEAEQRTVNKKTSQIKHPRSPNSGPIRTDQKEEGHTEQKSQKKQNSINVALEENNHGISGNKIQCKPKHITQPPCFNPPKYTRKETELSTVNLENFIDSDEKENNEEHEIFKKREKFKRNSEWNGSNTTGRGLSTPRQSVIKSLPQIMMRIKNIEEKIKELGKVREDKGKSLTNITNVMDISCDNNKRKWPTELKANDISNYHCPLTVCSNEKANKTLKIKTSKEEICLNNSEMVSINKKMRNEVGLKANKSFKIKTSKEEICLNSSEMVSITKKMRNKVASRQLVYHNIHELDAHNITSKHLRNASLHGYKNPKPKNKQYPKTTKVANKQGQVYYDMWRRISEELKTSSEVVEN